MTLKVTLCLKGLEVFRYRFGTLDLKPLTNVSNRGLEGVSSEVLNHVVEDLLLDLS